MLNTLIFSHAAPSSAKAIALASLSHVRPRPPLAAGAAFGRSGLPTAMMDISDGLAIDLERMCAASGTGARLDAWRIPLHPGAVRFLGGDGALRAALGGGEDYELLLAAPARSEATLRRLARRNGSDLLPIGEMRPRREGLRLKTVDGRGTRLPRLGYDHLAGR